MEKKKIIELTIEELDLQSGIDSISLVEEPAIEVSWVAFKKEKSNKFIIPDGEDQTHLDLLFKGGQPEQELLDEGWVMSEAEMVDVESFGVPVTHPNEESDIDTENVRIRYKYDLNPNIKQSKLIPTSRFYCQSLINKNYVWRLEELQNLNGNIDKNDGGFGGDAMTWRGGYACRHVWMKITYKPYDEDKTEKENKIINKASIKKNRETDAAGRAPDQTPHWEQPSTVTQKIRNNPSPQTVKNLGLSKEKTGFRVESTDKHIIVGPAMIPEQQMLRRRDGEEYYVYFTEETIRMIAEKYLRNGFNVSNDVDHDGNQTNDVYVIESWIKEDDNDKSTKYGYKDLPVGTWFVSMKVKNDEIWEKIKNEELKGFSVSGWFAEEIIQMEKEQEQIFIDELAVLLNMKKGE